MGRVQLDMQTRNQQGGHVSHLDFNLLYFWGGIAESCGRGKDPSITTSILANVNNTTEQYCWSVPSFNHKGNYWSPHLPPDPRSLISKLEPADIIDLIAKYIRFLCPEIQLKNIYPTNNYGVPVDFSMNGAVRFSLSHILEVRWCVLPFLNQTKLT